MSPAVKDFLDLVEETKGIGNKETIKKIFPNKLVFFVPMVPPTATEQQHRVFFANGHPVFYRDKKLREARESLIKSLKPFVPDVPYEGPVFVNVIWCFPYKKSENKKNIGKVIPKGTRPDLDNLNKNLLDCFNGTFLVDDAQIVAFSSSKCWFETTGIFISITPLNEATFEESILKRVKNKEIEE